MQVAQTLTDAAFAGNVDEVDRLLVTVPVNSRDKDGFAALHRVAVVGNVAMLTHLIKKGANVNLEDAVSKSYESQFFALPCVQRRHPACLVHLLLRNDVSTVNCGDFELTFGSHCSMVTLHYIMLVSVVIEMLHLR